MITREYRYGEFAEQNLAITLRSGPEYMVRCPFHDGTGSHMQFNAESGLFICFSCQAKGNINTLMRELGIKHINESMDTSDIMAKLDLLKKGGEPTDLPVLPESYLKRYQFPTRYWTDVRGYSEETITAFDLGYDPMDDAAIIPVRNVAGGLLGVIKRYLDAQADLRYKYPKGFKRSLHMFGSWLVERDPEATTVALVEGSLDAAAIWQAGHPALGQYGSSIGRGQIRLMRRLGITNVILFYDNDKAGIEATKYAQGMHATRDRKTKKLVYEYDPTTDLCRSFSVSIAEYPAGGYKDPDSLSSAQIIKSLKSAYPVA